MKERDRHLTELRPDLSLVSRPSDQAEEHFQNMSLRPIIKLQNDLLVEVFRNYLYNHKTDFSNLSLEDRLHFITTATQKDTKLRGILTGIVIGHFTLEEYQYYKTNSSSINKRIIQLISERLKGNLQLFEVLSGNHTER